MADFDRPSLAKLMGDSIVTVYVGPDRKRYMIHKELLTKQSDYFDRAFNRGFMETDDQSIHLPEETPGAFDLLIGFLYQIRIPVVGNSLRPFLRLEKKSPRNEKKILLNSSSRLFSTFPTVTDTFMRSPASLAGDNGPECTGTGQSAYHATSEPVLQAPHGENPFGPPPMPWTDNYQHICAMPIYMPHSPEELRLADYRDGRGVSLSFRAFSGGPSTFCAGLSATSRNDENLPPGNSSVTSKSVPGFVAGSPSRHKDKQKLSSVSKSYIPGIPSCRSLDELTILESNHQLALLQLCLLAETVCWDKLFDAAMSAYISGEMNLTYRTIPPEHISLIYERAHDESPCRAYAADAVVSQLRVPDMYQRYAAVMNDYPAFQEDIFLSLGKNPALSLRDPRLLGKCTYHTHAPGEICFEAEVTKQKQTTISGSSNSPSWENRDTSSGIHSLPRFNGHIDSAQPESQNGAPGSGSRLSDSFTGGGTGATTAGSGPFGQRGGGFSLGSFSHSNRESGRATSFGSRSTGVGAGAGISGFGTGTTLFRHRTGSGSSQPTSYPGSYFSASGPLPGRPVPAPGSGGLFGQVIPSRSGSALFSTPRFAAQSHSSDSSASGSHAPQGSASSAFDDTTESSWRGTATLSSFREEGAAHEASGSAQDRGDIEQPEREEEHDE